MSERRIVSFLAVIGPPLLVCFGLVSLWKLVLVGWSIPNWLVPPPEDVARALTEQRGPLLQASARTALAAAGGLGGSLLLGILTAFAFAHSSFVRRAFYPYAVLLQTVPVIAIAPLIILTFGRGFHSVTLVAGVISLFPIITSTTTGLLQIDPSLNDLFRLHRASWWQILWKLRLPCAIPWMISGTRIASGAAVVGAVVGEFFVGSGPPGLGTLIQRKTASLNLPELYAAVLASVVLGVSTFVVVTAAGDAVLQHWFGRRLNDHIAGRAG